MEQFELACRTSQILQSFSIRHALVGSLASMSYGEPRLTRDIDFVVEMTDGQVEPFCDNFRAPEYYVSTQAAREAVRNHSQFNIIHITSGNKVDLMLTKPNDWSRQQLGRVRTVTIGPDVAVPTASPEDIIVAKVWYFQGGGSQKHVHDIAGMFRHSAAEIDRAYIDHWTAELGLTKEWRMIQDAIQDES